MDVSIVVATFGDPEWERLARVRAVPTAQACGVAVHQVHGDTLHGARNAGLDQVTTEWVIFLDADDQLEPGYVPEMLDATADVRVPQVRYMYRNPRPARLTVPRVAGHAHQCQAACLPEGNWCVVGSMVRADLVRQVGGWRDFRWSEDWDLWLRCYLAGATFAVAPHAVYRAFTRPDSRNRSLNTHQRLMTHREIERANGLLPGGFLPDGSRP